MVDDLLRWLEQSEGPLAYLVFASCAALEYVVPPLPGDTVALFGAFLAAASGYDPTLTYLSLTLGSVAGSFAPYGLGRWIGGRPERWPGFLRGERTRRAIERVTGSFERRGASYLAVNRFVPAVRSVFFVAAGMAGMSWWRVAVYGGLSAALWNGCLFALGYGAGASFGELRAWVEQYTWLTAAVLVAALLLVGLALLIRARKR